MSNRDNTKMFLHTAKQAQQALQQHTGVDGVSLIVDIMVEAHRTQLVQGGGGLISQGIILRLGNAPQQLLTDGTGCNSRGETIETRQSSEKETKDHEKKHVSDRNRAKISFGSSPEWFIGVNSDPSTAAMIPIEELKGPISLNTLSEMWFNSEINENTAVYAEGMKWPVPISAVRQLRLLF